MHSPGKFISVACISLIYLGLPNIALADHDGWSRWLDQTIFSRDLANFGVKMRYFDYDFGTTPKAKNDPVRSNETFRVQLRYKHENAEEIQFRVKTQLINVGGLDTKLMVTLIGTDSMCKGKSGVNLRTNRHDQPHKFIRSDSISQSEIITPCKKMETLVSMWPVFFVEKRVYRTRFHNGMFINRTTGYHRSSYAIDCRDHGECETHSYESRNILSKCFSNNGQVNCP